MLTMLSDDLTSADSLIDSNSSSLKEIFCYIASTSIGGNYFHNNYNTNSSYSLLSHTIFGCFAGLVISYSLIKAANIIYTQPKQEDKKRLAP